MKRFYIFFCILLFSFSIDAAPFVVRESCVSLRVDSRNKKPARTQLPFKIGSSVQAIPAAGKKVGKFRIKEDSDLMTIPGNSKGVFYLVKRSCLSASESIKRQDPIQDISETPSIHSGTIFLQSTQSDYTVTLASGEDTDLSAHISAGAIEYFYAFPFGQNWLSFSGSFIYGQSEIGRSREQLSDLNFTNFNYQAKNVSSIGLDASIGYFIPFSNNTVLFGVRLPFRWMKIEFPLPGDGTTVSPTNDISLSYLMESRIQTGSMFWVQNFGFYKRFGQITWSLGMGYHF